MREDIRKLLEMIVTLNYGDEIDYGELAEIALKNNFEISESVIDLEEDQE